MTTIEQVGNAITRLNTKKALVDGIPVAAIKEATQMFPGNPNVDLRFKKEYFPSIWKEERLVFISKGGEHRLSIVLFTSSQTEVRSWSWLLRRSSRTNLRGSFWLPTRSNLEKGSPRYRQ